MYVCIYTYIEIVIESLCYIPETNTALQINCTSFFPTFGYYVRAQQSGAAVALSQPWRERGECQRSWTRYSTSLSSRIYHSVSLKCPELSEEIIYAHRLWMIISFNTLLWKKSCDPQGFAFNTSFQEIRVNFLLIVAPLHT